MSISNFGQFIEISQPNIHLSLYRGFLNISRKKELLDRLPLDDILALVVTGHGCSHSSNILSALAERNIPVSICGSNFSPKVLVLPVEGNCRQSVRVRGQVEASQPLKKRLWKQIVQWKLQSQAEVLKQCGLPYAGLLSMSKMVKSGDLENLEAHGARRYWIALFSKNFKRDQNGDGINAMLNYAYAVIRSCMARGVISAGLHPSIGIHHKNIYNSMCLVDDLMEPFRPIADYVVKQLYSNGYCEVDKTVKQVLSSIACVNVVSEPGMSVLFQVMVRFATTLALVLSKEKSVWSLDYKVNWNQFNTNLLSAKSISSSA